jgi:osmotically-inducible protein OsmY
VQDALNKELPTSNITVSSSSGNEIQLNGTVTSQSEKQRAEDIARSATHGQSIVNRITVSGSSPDQSNPNQSNPK